MDKCKDRVARHSAEIVNQAILMYEMLGAECAIEYCEKMGVSREIFDRVFNDPTKRRCPLKPRE